MIVHLHGLSATRPSHRNPAPSPMTGVPLRSHLANPLGRSWSAAVGAALCAAVLACAPAAALAVVPWMTETIDATGNTGQYSSLAIGLGGSLHVGYHDVTNDILRYAYNANVGGPWTLQTAASPNCGVGVSMAVDPFTNEPRITHEGSLSSLAISSRKIAGVWNTQSFAGETTLNGSTATLLSPSGELDAAFQYMDYGNGFTGYPALVRLNGNVWTPELMGGGGYNSIVGGALSGANDYATGYQHFACDGVLGCCSKKLAHATRTGAYTYTWDYLTAVGTWPLATSTAVDAASQPQIAWISTTSYVSTSGPLMFVHKVGASWVTESVDGSPCNWPSVAIDPSGNIHIAYCNVGNGRLYYASRSPAGWWTTELLGVTGETAQNASLALDATGNPHIAWYDATGGDLRHTWRNACTPPPTGLAAWWPFDEGTGSFAQDVVGGNAVSFAGTAAWSPGQLVTTSVDLNPATTQYMSRPTQTPGNFLDLGVGDLTVSTWYRTNDSYSGPIRVLYDQRDGTNGIELFLYNGALGVQLMTGATYGNFIAPGPNVWDTQWHHLTATVQRWNPSGGLLYVDGQLVYTFDPTAFAGSLNSTGAVVIGDEYAHIPGNRARGQLDEMQLYKRALSSGEVFDLYTAGGAGACKVFARLPSVIGICPSVLTATVNLQVFNYTPSNKNFSWSMAGLPAVAPYNLAGPTTFAPPSGGTGVLSPYTSTSIPVVITKPFGLSGTAYAGYRATLTDNATLGQMWTDGGMVSGGGFLCLTWTSVAIDLPWNTSQELAFTVTNTDLNPRSFTVRVVEVAAGENAGSDGSGSSSLVSLNGLPPGIPWEASYSLAGNGSTDVVLNATARGFDPFRATELQLRADTNGDGIEDFAATLPVTQGTSSLTSVPATGAGRPSRELSLRTSGAGGRGAVSLLYSIPAADVVSLDVVDARGRLARTLQRAPQTAGSHHVQWDGRDDSGRQCAAGLYFARLKTRDGGASAKIVRLVP